MSALKWRGPWIGKVNPTVVGASGTFSLRPTSLDSSDWAVLAGTVLGAVQPGTPDDASQIQCGNSSTALARFLCDPDTALYLDYSPTPTPVSSLPGSFTITSLYIQVGGKTGTGDVWCQFSEAHEVDPAVNSDYPDTLPTIAALCSEGMGVRADCGPADTLEIGTRVDPAGDGSLTVIGEYTT